MKQPVVSGFSITVVLLVVIGWFSYSSILEFRATANLVSKAHNLANIRESLLTDVASAESEARGYVIMGKDDYLDLYRKAVADVRKSLDAIKAVRSDTTQPALVDKTVELVEMRLDRLRITIETKQAEGLDAVVGIAGIGKRLMDDLRAVSSELEHADRKALNDAALQLASASKRTTWIIGLGSILAVLFHLLSTIALGRATANRERLERSLMEVSEREQRRIGQDLHDGLCQQLTGVSLLARSLGKDLPPAASASLRQIVDLINGCIEETRLVTRGLHPVPDEPGGLAIGLREMVEIVRTTSNLRCELQIRGDLLLNDIAVASNLYRIAQEAVRNAVRHSEATLVSITVEATGDLVSLQITDNGKGIQTVQERRGLGLEIMKYRAFTIGGSVQIFPNTPRGTIVRFSSKRRS
jgi:signal transduction histidine kinase